MKRFFCLLVLCLLMVAQFAQAGDYAIATINNPKAPHTVHLRAGKGTSTESLGEYYSGVTVVVYDSKDDWWQVEIHGRKGYINSDFLIPSGSQGHRDEAAIASAYQATVQAVVNNPDSAERLNLRSRPDKDASAHGKYYSNTPVEILGNIGGYSLVIVNGSDWGYMQTKHLKTGVSGSPAPAAVSANDIQGYAVVNNPKVEDKLYLRAAAKESTERLGEYANGTTVELLARDGNYWHVRIFDKTGYMHADYLRPDTHDTIVLTHAVLQRDETGSNVPLFAYPATNAPTLITSVPEGTRAKIISRAGVWYLVEVEGKQGYVQTQWVLPGTDTPGRYGVIANPNARDRLHLRDKAGTSGQSLGQYFNGTQVEILSGGEDVNLLNWQSSSGWYRVRVDGKEGYMMTKFVSPVSVGDPSTW